MKTLPKIPGVEVSLGGEVYVLPPIALGPLRILQSRLKNLTDSTDPMDPASLDTIVDATFASMKRNYPEMTVEQVSELVDLGNMGEVLSAVMDVSGMLRRSQAEGKKLAATSQT